jgi:hypothetical protein
VQQQANLRVHEIAHVSRKPQSGFAAEMGFAEAVTGSVHGMSRVPDPQLMADLIKFNDELLEAGVLIGYDGLHPSSKGARVHFSGKKRTVTDGSESKELIAGIWFWQVKSLEEAIEWAKRCPNDEGESDIEIRQIAELEDFASAFTPEEIQQEKDFRARMAANAAKK